MDFTTDTVFGVWDQENRHDVSFDEITVTFQDSSIPLTRSIDPGKPFLTFSEGTRSIADISFPTVSGRQTGQMYRETD